MIGLLASQVVALSGFGERDGCAYFSLPLSLLNDGDERLIIACPRHERAVRREMVRRETIMPPPISRTSNGEMAAVMVDTPGM